MEGAAVPPVVVVAAAADREVDDVLILELLVVDRVGVGRDGVIVIVVVVLHPLEDIAGEIDGAVWALATTEVVDALRVEIAAAVEGIAGVVLAAPRPRARIDGPARRLLPL